ncbi:MAG: basic amino acid/polyamine antiporter, family [Alphaproteobacteria bacterium]|jgi:APA family basic amino acid/polyamine antiporter|nr:basic amino acid/polyamine antiporter, family [Alphaproteobacteria bacterium]
MNLFAKKLPAADEVHGLRRCLTASDLTFMGIGQMIGTGIFVLTGVAAATQAGPAIILSFVVAGIACAFVAFAYAELASSVGGSGAAYGFAYAAFGELPAWTVGWNLVFGLGTALAAVANGWSGYFNNALAAMGFGLPEFLTKGPFAGGLINVPAVAVILTLMLALFAGVKQSARLNKMIVFAKLSAIAIFIGVAVFHVNPALWHPFMPYGWFSHRADGGTVGILAGASLVFFAYRGFQNVSIAVEEAQNPQRDVPIGVIASLTICTLIYLTVSGLLTAIAPYDVLNVSSPVAYALLRLGYNWGSALVATGVIIGLTSTMLVLFYGLTRILFAMARDGLLPSFFSALDATTRTPANAIVLCGVTLSLVAGLVPLGALAELVNAGTLTEFMLVCIGVIVLRLTRPEIKRPFKAPGGVIIPVLGVISCGALLSFLPLVTLGRFAAYLVVGVAVYFGYAARRNRVEPGDTPDEIIT